jgi:aminoglycoside phosphotransferase (APT) family kinase protein
MDDPSLKVEYENYRQERIRAMTSPDDLINQIVERAAHSPLANKVRVTEGFSNEVYQATTEDGQRLIVRIHWDSPHFEPETWALKRCEAIDLPAPRILLLEQDLPGDVPRSACVETYLPGRTLHSLLEEQVYLPQDCRTLLIELGALLARLHTIPTRGFGRIDGNGTGAARTWANYLHTQTDQQLLKATENIGIDLDQVRVASRLLADQLPMWEPVQPRLLHGDISLSHVMVDQDHVCGLIDFEFPRSGDPAMDLAYWGCWDAYGGFSLPLEWILAGYRQKAEVEAAFLFRITACRLQLSLELLRYHGIQDANSPGMRAYLQERFQRDLRAMEREGDYYW